MSLVNDRAGTIGRTPEVANKAVTRLYYPVVGASEQSFYLNASYTRFTVVIYLLCSEIGHFGFASSNDFLRSCHALVASISSPTLLSY